MKENRIKLDLEVRVMYVKDKKLPLVNRTYTYSIRKNVEVAFGLRMK